MPRKLRNPKERIDDVSETALWVLGDRTLYPEPEKVDEWELLILDFPTCQRGHVDEPKELWDSCKEIVLRSWVREYPGTRPSYWWPFDAPRMIAADITRAGWDGCFWAPRMTDTRKRLGGIGDPKFQHLHYVPHFECGIPDSWVERWEVEYYNGRSRDVYGHVMGTKYKPGDFRGVAIDPNDPPRFESQASYLERHNLLTAAERARLKAADWEPEIVEANENEE